MKILIIGGTGFIGSNLQLELEDKHELIIFHRGNKSISNKYESIIGERKDLLNYRWQFEKIQPDLVIDLISYFAQDTWDLVNTFKQITNRVIIISSGDVYKAYEIFKDNRDELIEEACREEDELRTRLYPYRGIDSNNYLLENYEKIIIENIIRCQEEFNWTILRLGALYGEYDNQRKLKEYIEPMLKQERVIKIDKKKVGWKWTRAYIGNVVSALRLVIEKESESSNELFNIGNKKAYEEIEIINHLKGLTGWNGELQIVEEFDKEPYNYDQHLILNTNKIRQKLGYTERYNFEEGLKRTIRYEEKLTR